MGCTRDEWGLNPYRGVVPSCGKATKAAADNEAVRWTLFVFLTFGIKGVAQSP